MHLLLEPARATIYEVMNTLNNTLFVMSKKYINQREFNDLKSVSINHWT